MCAGGPPRLSAFRRGLRATRSWASSAASANRDSSRRRGVRPARAAVGSCSCRADPGSGRRPRPTARRPAPRAHLLMIATFRSSGLSDQSPLTSLLADLRREQDAAIRLVLEGLGEEDIVALMEGIAGHDLGRPGITLARDLHRETNGNPFFIFELLRHLRATG